VVHIFVSLLQGKPFYITRFHFRVSEIESSTIAGGWAKKHREQCSAQHHFASTSALRLRAECCRVPVGQNRKMTRDAIIIVYVCPGYFENIVAMTMIIMFMAMKHIANNNFDGDGDGDGDDDDDDDAEKAKEDEKGWKKDEKGWKTDGKG